MNFSDGGHSRGLKRRAAFPSGILGAFLCVCLSLLLSPAIAQEQPQKVTPQELQSMLQKGEATLVNIMSGLECRDHQIPGSVCIPCEEFSGKAPAILKGRPQQLVIYGDRDRDAAACLQSLGAAAREFKISVLDGGLAGWKRAGLETDSPGRVPRYETTSISAASLRALLTQGKPPVIIDIRPEQAFNAGHISGALNIPLNQLPARYYEIPSDRPIVITDEDGRRSFLAASYLVRRGFGSVQAAPGRHGGLGQRNCKGGKEVKAVLRTITLSLLLAFALACPALSMAAQTGCTSCHEDQKYKSQFASSVHGRTGCLSCHKIDDVNRHARGEERPALISCGTCHADIARDYAQDAHNLQLELRCYDCHRDIHTLQRLQKSKSGIIQKCSGCHASEDYAAKGHGAAVLRGNNDAASCADCHGLHGIRAFRTDEGPLPADAKLYFMPKCAGCHTDPELAKRNGLNPKVIKEYEETYHGKVSKVGYPAPVAGCADCHGSHNILPPDNPQSALSVENRAAMCGKCHSGFNPRFASYIAHPDYGNPKKYPVLYAASIFMIVLIVGVFIFFWTHTLLWWRKSYWETCVRKKPEPGKTQPEQCDDRAGPTLPSSLQGHARPAYHFVFHAGHDRHTPEVPGRRLGARPDPALGRGPRLAACSTGSRPPSSSAPVPVHDLALPEVPFPRRAGEGLAGQALRSGFPFPQPQGPARHQGHVSLVLQQGRDAEARPLDLLGEIRFPGGLLGDVRHRAFRAHALVPGKVLVHIPGLVPQYCRSGPFRRGAAGRALHLHGALFQ